jgi:dihydrofolate synthase/folylpolyglutamate synthase
MKIQSFEDVERLLFSRISKSQQNMHAGPVHVARMRFLLKKLGNPQNSFKTVHVVGTSGKGSTVLMTGAILSALGTKIGTTFSPHIETLRERICIDGEPVADAAWICALEKILPYVEEMSKTVHGSPTYYELIIVLAFIVFAQEKVDYVVVEAGVGGLFDSTNVFDREDTVVLITSVSYDHMKMLGNTLEEIAFQKSGVIKSHNQVFAAQMQGEVADVINYTATITDAHVRYICKGREIKNIQAGVDPPRADFQLGHMWMKDVEVGLDGEHQVQNAALALSAAYHICERDDLVWNEECVRSALAGVVFAGRFHMIYVHGKMVILDAAHNEEKTVALAKTFTSLFPKHRAHLLYACKREKSAQELLEHLQLFCDSVCVTDYTQGTQAILPSARTTEELKKDAQNGGFTEVCAEKNPETAFEKILLHKDTNVIIVTGSFYLLSRIYPLTKDKTRFPDKGPQEGTELPRPLLSAEE